MIPDHVLADLASLTQAQRFAVNQAFKEWVLVGRQEGYKPMDAWGNFAVEVDHSALLFRLLSGKPALPEKPPLRHAYPDYDAAEQNTGTRPDEA